MKKKLIIGGIVIAAILVVLFLVLGNINSIIKKGVETAGPKILKAPVALNKVNISVSSGSGELIGFTVGNPAGYKTEYAFQLDKVKVDLDVKSVTSEKIHIKNVSIDSPKIIYEGTFGKSNISQLQENAKTDTSKGTSDSSARPKEEDSGSSGKSVQIDYLKIANGSISVSMGILQGKKLTIPLPTIELRDIGKDKKANFSDAMGEVLGAINSAAVPAIQSGVTGLGKGLQDAGGTLQEGAEKGLDKIKGLFGK